MQEKNLNEFFRETFKEARVGIKHGHGGPFGAVVVKGGKIISKGHNTVLKNNDPTCHAEVNALRAACKKLKSPHIEDCILIASSEPCPMCLTTAYWANVKEIYYCVDKKTAARVGFDDDFIYKELDKSPEKRKIKLVHRNELESEGAQIFTDWQKLGGKLY